MLKINNLTKSFGTKNVLKDFSYNFEKGKTYCLFGKSGCGKTTLLNIIAGIIKPDSGKVIIDKNTKVRMVFQEPRLLPWRNAIDNICISGSDKDQAMSLLEAFALEGDAFNYPDSLSSGMCRRVAIARALNDNPDILLLDEPFSGLDLAMSDKAIQLIKETMEGKLIIFVTHNKSEALKLSDKILFLSDKQMEIENDFKVN